MFDSKEKKVFDTVLKLAKSKLSAERVILFGSRARRDHNERSDYDIAIEYQDDTKNWNRFVTDVEDRIPTLCSIDLVRFDHSLDPGFRSKIESEGVVLNESA